jgi:DNA-binding winged helix-turn-helix (wHTH) protein/pimeloyl-ACP methyl ester carboxylesterase
LDLSRISKISLDQRFLSLFYRFGDCELDTASRGLKCAGLEVAIEPQVFDLLQLLAENPSRLVTKDEIIAAVWGGRVVSESAVSARIAAARRAIGDDGKQQKVIRTHHGRGLEMVAVVTVGVATDRLASEKLTTPKVRYTTSKRGHSLAYLVSGSGPPLFQLDGPPLSKEKAWHIPVLRDGYDAYRKGRTFVQLDWAGTGLSEALDEALSIEENVEDIAAVADAAGLDRFALMSESGACIEAVTFAAKYPERLTELVIVGGYAEGRQLRETEGRPEVLMAMMEAGWDQHGGGIATAFLTAYFPEGPAEGVRQVVGLMQESASQKFMLDHRERSNNASIIEVLNKVVCPTLIVQGRDDAIHPLVQAQKLAAGIHDSELLVLESANHLPLPGHPTFDVFISALRDFLDA